MSKNKDKNKELQYEYRGKDGTFIRTFTLKKAQKGQYKNDIIGLEIKSVKGNWDFVLTPKEAIVICAGLSVAFIGCKKQDKRTLQ